MASTTTIELIAIEKALQIAEENLIEKPIIFTDSLTACNTIKRTTTETKIEEIVYNILNKAQNTKADIVWIPAHTGITGNEKADELAKRGTISNTTIKNKIRYIDAINTFRSEMMSKTNLWFTHTSKKKEKNSQYSKTNLR